MNLEELIAAYSNAGPTSPFGVRHSANLNELHRWRRPRPVWSQNYPTWLIRKLASGSGETVASAIDWRFVDGYTLPTFSLLDLLYCGEVDGGALGSIIPAMDYFDVGNEAIILDGGAI